MILLSSLVPVDALRPFGPNWVLYSSKSTGTRFQKALVESKDPEKYRHFELMHKQSSLNNLSDAESSRNILNRFTDDTCSVDGEEEKRTTTKESRQS